MFYRFKPRRFIFCKLQPHGNRVVESVHAWMKDYHHVTGYHPTTGWIAYRLLREQFPAARITPVDFRPDGDVGTYKWPKHDWVWEAEFYRKHGVEMVSAKRR